MEYRVFDKKRKKWVNDDVYLNPEGELFKSGKLFLGMNKPTFLDQNRYVYQRYIELSDKNGTPVFVWDVLEAHVEDGIVKGVVIFAKELSSYVILCDEINKYYVLGEYVVKEIEVIGNVFDDDSGKKKHK